MTDDDRFERDLAAVVRSGAPDVAPAALRQRVAASVGSGARRPTRRVPVFAVIAAAIVVVAVGLVGAPWLRNPAPGATQPGTIAASSGTNPPASAPPVSPSAPTIAETITDPGQVQVGRLFTATAGWVVNTDGHVFLTRSGGVAWRDVTPPGIGSNAKLSPFFVDPLHGWVGEFDDPNKADMAVWRTTDAGVTWTRTVLSGVRTASWGLVFQSPIVGWLATDPGGDHPKPELRWTNDGGSNWSDPIDLAAATGLTVLPDLAFADQEHGTLATIDGIVRVTVDGGRTWTNAQMPRQPAVATEPGNVLRLGTPTFVDPVHGFLEGDVVAADSTELTHLVYATDSAGAAWHLVLRDDLRRHWAFLTETAWIGLSEGQVWMTRDGGATFLVQDSTGLPSPLDRAYMTFADPTHGWGAVVQGGCLPGRFGCLRGPELFGTSDGGEIWTRIGDCIFLCASPKPG
jgi:photosystem II stability/assembly factor-like uncharacterized protein